MRIVIWLLLSAPAILAQTPRIILPNYFPPQLKEYLALSDDQMVRMNNAREQSILLQQPKLLRQGVLYAEISVETAKAVPDPAALGSRYAELELIRRDLDALQKSLIPQMQAILGADQKTKLASLQQALTLYSTACEAVSQTLLVPPGILATGGLLTTPVPISRLPFPGTVLTGCTGSTIIPVIRTGDFSTTPQP